MPVWLNKCWEAKKRQKRTREKREGRKAELGMMTGQRLTSAASGEGAGKWDLRFESDSLRRLVLSEWWIETGMNSSSKQTCHFPSDFAFFPYWWGVLGNQLKRSVLHVQPCLHWQWTEGWIWYLVTGGCNHFIGYKRWILGLDFLGYWGYFCLLWRFGKRLDHSKKGC